MNPEGHVIIMQYRDDGITPFFTFFKDGLTVQKLVRGPSRPSRLTPRSNAQWWMRAALLCVVILVCASAAACHNCSMSAAVQAGDHVLLCADNFTFIKSAVITDGKECVAAATGQRDSSRNI